MTAEDKLSELEDWYKKTLLLEGLSHRQSTEPIDKWMESAPQLRRINGLRQVTGLVSGMEFKDKLILFDKQSLEQLGRDNLRQSLVHCFSHWLKGGSEAHEDRWMELYLKLCHDHHLAVNVEELSNQNLREDCSENTQRVLESLVIPRVTIRKARRESPKLSRPATR